MEKQKHGSKQKDGKQDNKEHKNEGNEDERRKESKMFPTLLHTIHKN